MSELRPSICCICNKGCPLLLEVEDGRLVGVQGDRSNSLYAGYTCVKGRALPAFVNHPDRLLHSCRRTASGEFERIPVAQVMDDVANRLRSIVDEHGPRAVAVYSGTQFQNLPAKALLRSFMEEIGSPMTFSAFTVDKPGRAIAWTMLGRWMAPPQGFHDPKVAVLIGINPFVNGLGGVPNGHPAKWLAERIASGMDLIVIDPRESDVAKRATVFLQPRPGHDIPILAAMLRVILAEGLHDRQFLAEHVRNVDVLERTVAGFDPAVVADAAGLDVDDLVRAARVFATAGRGYVVAGTGPHFAGQGTLLEYLALCLDTVCGHWMRTGETVLNTGVLGAPVVPKAQAANPLPAYGFGERSRVRGLGMSAAGMPSATLAEEILLEGEGRVRALISVGGNPVAAFPDQLQTIEALRSLDLLVQIDPWMSQTAELATYVVAPRMTPEMIETTVRPEKTPRVYATGYGFAVNYAQYTPATVEPPPGSEVIEDWEFFYGLGQRMNLRLKVTPEAGPPIDVDMEQKPTSDELVEAMFTGSRVPLDVIKSEPHGAFFPSEPPVVVQPKDEGWTGRLDVGNADLMADLAAFRFAEVDDAAFPLRLINRRMMSVVNSSYNVASTGRGRPDNPAYMHPDDVLELDLEAGCAIVIESERSIIPAVVEVDATLRPGTVSMSGGFGGGPDTDHLFELTGSSVARLLSTTDGADKYSGQPRMSNVPIRVRRQGV